MKRPSELIAELFKRHEAIAMATLVSARGSSSAKVGSRMWIGPDGAAIGAVTIGGFVPARARDGNGGGAANGETRTGENGLWEEGPRPDRATLRRAQKD